MKEVYVSRHARRRMRLHGITLEQVTAPLPQPDDKSSFHGSTGLTLDTDGPAPILTTQALQQAHQLPGWQHQMPVAVNNTLNPIGLVDYQVLVVLDTSALIAQGQMQEDGADIRFTDGAGNLLSYWVESGVNTQATRVWVKVPEIPASARTTIYLHFGNAEAISATDGSATFLFFDEFEATVLDLTAWDTDGYGAWPGLRYALGEGRLATWSDGGWKLLRPNRFFSATDQVRVVARFMAEGNMNWLQNYLVQETNTDRNRFGLQASGSTGWQVQFQEDGGGWQYSSLLGNVPAGQWGVSEIVRESPDSFRARLYSDSYATLGTFARTSTAWADETWTWVAWRYSGIKGNYDWLFIAKATSPEPLYVAA